jgi:hypothetical protein
MDLIAQSMDSAPSQAYAFSRMARPQAYAQRRVRRSARRAPAAAAPGGTPYDPGSGPPPYNVRGKTYAQQPLSWHAAPARTDAATSRAVPSLARAARTQRLWCCAPRAA